jgi:2-oxoisovalerate dehydrogenase E1 component
MKYIDEMALAIRIRCVEEALLNLYSQGKLNGTVHTCIGQEFTGVAISKFLLENDFVLSNHRGHGHYIARTSDIEGLFSELMGKVSGCSGGIGGSQHLYNSNFLSNGIQGGMTPVAAGISMNFKLKGTNDIVVVYIGDGTLGEGILYETFNIVSKWNLPVLFVLENNGISQSTDIKQTLAGDIGARCEGFGINYLHTTTNDLEDLFSSSSEAISYVRNNSKPTLIEIKTNRLFSHSKGDDNRDLKHIESLQKVDPINIFVLEHPDEYKKIKIQVLNEIESAISFAEGSETLLEFENPPYFFNRDVSYSPLEQNGQRNNEEIYNFFKQEMEADASIILLGEDIETSNEYNTGEYGGAFKVTRDLSKLFPGRVINTPISEAAVVGIGSGLALGGYKPVIEIMFGDFLTLTFDQLLQHTSKFGLMYNEKVSVPLIIRTPMGGHRGYGPTHSQSIEKFFLGIPGLSVLSLNHRLHPHVVYSKIFSGERKPYLIIENKVVYTKYINLDPIIGYNIEFSDDDFPYIRISSPDKKPDVTIIGYGGTLLEIEAAISLLFKEEIICEVICPTALYPLNIGPIKSAVNKTNNLIIVEEGTNAMAFGSEILAILAELGATPKKVRRMGNNTIIPCSFQAEQLLLPNAESIFNVVLDIL